MLTPLVSLGGRAAGEGPLGKGGRSGSWHPTALHRKAPGNENRFAFGARPQPFGDLDGSAQSSTIQNNGYQCSRLKFPNVFNRHLLTILPYVSCRATTHGCGALFGRRTMADVGVVSEGDFLRRAEIGTKRRWLDPNDEAVVHAADATQVMIELWILWGSCAACC